MTATTTENGFSARIACTAVAFAMAVGAASVASPAQAAQQDEPAAPVVHLSAGANGLVAPGSSATASVTVQNDDDEVLTPRRVVVELNRSPLSDAEAIDSWLEEGDAEGSFEPIGTDSTEEVDAGSSVTASIPIPQDALADLTPGVYPLRAQVDGGTSPLDEPLESTSVLVISGEQHSQVTVFVPITATPADGALLTSDELTELTAADGDLTAQLDGVSGTAAVLAIDPAIIAAIRVLGTSAPATATAWLDRLENLPNERFLLQFGDADATTQAQADLPALLEPGTFAPFLDPANFAAVTPPTATPAATPSPAPTDGPVLPDDATFTTLEGAVEGLLWPRGDVTTQNLDDFRTYLDGTSTTILPSTSFEGSPTAHAAVGVNDVVVTDAAASAALSEAAGESGADRRSQLLAAANAHLFLAAQHGQTPLAVGLRRDESRTAAALRETVATVDSTGVDLTSLRQTPAQDAVVDDEVSDDRGAALGHLLSDESALVQLSSVLDDPQVLLSPERIRILRVIGVGLGSTRFDDALSAHREATQATLDAVGIAPSSTIQLLSANADLPFAVRNDLAWPVNVVLSVSPSDPRLDVQRVTVATIPAGTTTRVKVPVSARVGSGELDLRLSLASPTGVPLGDQQTVRVSVRAEWESIGLAVFGSLIVILIGLGIVRTLRRRRKGADAEADAESGAGLVAESDAGADAGSAAGEESK